MKLISLHRMGSRWYAGIRDGNLTVGGLGFGAPTEFSAAMSREEVLTEIQRQTPELEICPSARQEPGS